MKIHPLITTTEALRDLCDRLSHAEFVTVDTEFMRENTFWPELCLVQIADTEEAAAIDPLAPGIDLKPLLDLLVDNEDVLKVFHAGGQDVEIVFNLTGKTPHPIFDTQIAMMAISQSEQIGYSNLCEIVARADGRQGRAVHRLVAPPARRAADRLCDRRRHPSRQDLPADAQAADQDRARRMARRGDGEARRSGQLPLRSRRRIWQRIRVSSRNPAVLGRLKALAAWRETEAMDKNIPRGRIARDETLADIASHPPQAQADLGKVRGLSAGWKENEIGRRLMGALADAVPLPDSELPPRAPRGAPLGKEGALVADLLKLLLKIRCREIDVSARLLARSDELEALAAGQRKGLAILEGWRYETFGRDALELVEGRTAFAVAGGQAQDGAYRRHRRQRRGRGGACRGR